MLSESELSVVDRIAGRVADLFYFTKIPHEDRTVWSQEDLRQEFVAHILHRLESYDSHRPLGPWSRTVIYNRARTIVTDLWREKWHRTQSAGEIDVDRVYFTQYEQDASGMEAPVPVFICEATPEDVLILLDEILAEELRPTTDRGARAMADSKPTETTVEEIRDLAGLVGVDLEADSDPMQSLEDVLFYALNDMDEDKFDELAEATRDRLQSLGDQFMANEVKIVRRNGASEDEPEVEDVAPKETRGKSTPKKKTASKKAAAKSTQKKKPAGKKKATGKKKTGRRPATADGPTGTGPKSAAKVTHARNPDGTATRQHFTPEYLQAQAEASGRKGPIYWLRHFFDKGKGLTTVPELAAALQKKRIKVSPETIRTHVRDLCRYYGVEPQRRKRGPKGRGVQNAIEDAYAAGKRTVAEVAKYLERKKIDAAPSTIKSAVSALRRNDPEIRKATGKKKPATKKKSTGKKKPASKKKKAKATQKKKPATKKKKAETSTRKKAPAKKKATAKKRSTARASRKKKADAAPPELPPDEEQQTGRRSARRRSSRRRSSED